MSSLVWVVDKQDGVHFVWTKALIPGDPHVGSGWEDSLGGWRGDMLSGEQGLLQTCTVERLVIRWFLCVGNLSSFPASTLDDAGRN